MTSLTNTYALGDAEAELDRLVGQAGFFGDLTEHLFHLAGIEPGMRVLDIGCGPGDVSFLAARLVGTDGAVIGVDASPDAIALARARAEQARLDHVRFLVGDLTTFTLDSPVDALVGRLILMHLPDPGAVLHRLCEQLPPGALVVCQEPDLAGVTTEPHCPLVETTVERIRETLRRVGADVRAGVRLRRIFRSAGLPEPRMILGARVESGPDSLAYAQITTVARSLLAPMEQTGVASAAEVDIETLAARLRAEVVATEATLVSPHLIGAWTTR